MRHSLLHSGVWPRQEDDRLCQQFETDEPHGDFTAASHHMRQAEAIKAWIEYLIEVAGEAWGEIATPADPRGME